MAKPESFSTWRGTAVVRSSRDGALWQSRAYVNNGETATMLAAKHRTRPNAQKWAEKVLTFLVPDSPSP